MASLSWYEGQEAQDSRLSLFAAPDVDTTSVDHFMVEYSPVSQILKGSAIEFNVKCPNYVDLQRSRLSVKVRLELGNGTPIPNIDIFQVLKDSDPPLDSNGECGPVNALFYAIHSQVDFSLNQQNTTTSLTTNGYPYKCLIDMLLSKPSPEQRAVLFVEDDYDMMEAMSPYLSNMDNEVNDGLTTRAAYLTGGKELRMEGKLRLDMFDQPRLLLKDVNMSLKLWPNNPAFYLMSPHTQKGFRIVITEAKLKLCHVKLNQAVISAIDTTLKTQPALYPINRSIVKTYTIAKNSHSATIDGIFPSECPENLIIGLVPSASFNGSYEACPWNFKNYSLSFLGFYINDKSVPAKPLTPHFGDTVPESDITEAWLNLYKYNPDIEISQKKFISGHTLYYLQLTDLESSDVVGLTKTGHTRLELKFKKELPESVNVIIYAKIRGMVSIDKDNQVTIK